MAFGKSVLGTAALRIIADTSRFAEDLKKQADKAGGGVGSTLAAAAGKTAKAGMVTVGATAVTALGYTLTKGFQRLKALDTARGQFKGLGLDVEATMKQVAAGVTNTSLSMAEGAQVAVAAMSTGNLPLQELEAQIKRVSNVAAAYGVDASQAGYLLNNVLVKNKVTWGDLSQMQRNNIPVVTALAKEYGVTGDEIMGMAQKGLISIDDLNRVLDEEAGAAAEEYAKTWEGMSSNIQANIGKIGAAFLGPLFEQAKEGLGKVYDLLTDPRLTEWATTMGEKAGAAFSRIVEGIQGITELIIGGNFSEALRNAFGVEEDHPVVTFLLNLRQTVIDVFNEVSGAVAAFGAAWTANDGDITSSGLAGFMEGLGYAMRQTFDYVKDDVIPALMDFGGWLNDNREEIGLVVAMVGGAVAGFKAYTAAVKAINAVKAIWAARTKAVSIATALFNKVMSANPIMLIVMAIGALVAGLIYLYHNNEKVREAIDKAWRAIKNAIGFVVDWVTETAWPALQGAWDAISGAAQTLWGHIQTAWDQIKAVIEVVVSWLTDTAWPFVKGVFDAIGSAVEFLYVNFIRPQWVLIRMAIEGVVSWLVNTAWPFIKSVWDLIAAGAKWLYEKAIKPIWDGIKKAIDFVVNWLRNTAWPWIKDVWDRISSGVKVMWEKWIKPAWDSIKSGIDTVVGWLRNTAWPFIKGVWDSIGDGARKLWNDWIKPAFDNMKSGVDRVVEAFGKAKDAIANVWGKVKDAVMDPIKSALKWLNDKFIKPLNNIFGKLGMTLTIPTINVSGMAEGGRVPAFAGGGRIPGPWRGPRADNVLGISDKGVPVARVNPREYILPVRATDRLMRSIGPMGLEMLRRGQVPGYALGGLVGAAWDWAKQKGSDVIDAGSALAKLITDGPKKILERLISSIAGSLLDNPLAQVGLSAAKKAVQGIAAKIDAWLGSEGGGTRAGAGMGWRAMKAWFESTFPGQRITSGFRPGAVSVTGVKSDHALGRAIDMPPSMAIFNTIDRTWKNIRQLLYSPAGGRQIRGYRRSDTSGALRAQHWDHVHWAMAQGGLVPLRPFVADNGVLLKPGLNLLDNRTGKPEPLTRADQPMRLHPDDRREIPSITLVVNNPISEPTEVTLNRQMQRLAALGVV